MNRPISIPIPGFRPDQVGVTGRAIVASETPALARDAIGLGVGDNVTLARLTLTDDVFSYGITTNSITSRSQAWLGIGQAGANSAESTVGISYAGLKIRSDKYFGFGSTINLNHAEDVRLYRGGPGILQQRNGANPQAYHLSNTYTDANTFERLQIAAAGDSYRIGSARGFVGGLNKPIEIGAYTGAGTFIPHVHITTAGNLTCSLNNTDTTTGRIVRAATFHSGQVYHAVELAVGGVDGGGSSGGYGRIRGGRFLDGRGLQLVSRGNMDTDDNSYVKLYQGAIFLGGDTLETLSWVANRLRFGGGTADFPALNRDGSTLRVRLADDSGYAPLEAGNLTASGPVKCTELDFGDNAGYARKITPQAYGVLIPANSTIASALETGNNRVMLSSGINLAWYFGGALTTELHSRILDTLQQRIGTRPQTYELANTYTDANTYEMLRTKATGSAYQIGSIRGFVGGQNRPIEIGHSDGSDNFTAGLTVGTSGFVKLQPGASNNPTLRFGEGLDGLYLIAQSTAMGLALNGTERIRFQTQGIRIAGTGSVSSPMIASIDASNSGFYYASSGVNNPPAISHAGNQIAEFGFYDGSSLWSKTHTKPALKLIAHASQSGNLQEWMSSASVVLASVGKFGTIKPRAGTADPDTAPLKFTTGTLQITPEPGALEYDGTNLYFTDAGGTRRQLQVV